MWYADYRDPTSSNVVQRRPTSSNVDHGRSLKLTYFKS